MNGPPGVDLSVRHVLDLLGEPMLGFVREAVQYAEGDVHKLAECASQVKSRFLHEALVTCLRAQIDYFGFRPRLDVEELAHFRRAGFGIPESSPVAHLRSHAENLYMTGTPRHRELELVLWGPTVPHGKPLFDDVRMLMKSDWIETTEFVNLPFASSKAALVKLWTEFGGVWHPKTVKGIVGLLRWCQDQRRSRHPPDAYAPLDGSMLDLAKTHAGGHAIKAFYVFACLSRAKAYLHEGHIRWRRSWLRGSGGDGRAIPGASAHGGWLSAIMKEHVLLQVKGAQWGKKAALYQPRIELQPGYITIERAARLLGLVLNQKGYPVQRRR